MFSLKNFLELCKLSFNLELLVIWRISDIGIKLWVLFCYINEVEILITMMMMLSVHLKCVLCVKLLNIEQIAWRRTMWHPVLLWRKVLIYSDLFKYAMGKSRVLHTSDVATYASFYPKHFNNIPSGIFLKNSFTINL